MFGSSNAKSIVNIREALDLCQSLSWKMLLMLSELKQKFFLLFWKENQHKVVTWKDLELVLLFTLYSVTTLQVLVVFGIYFLLCTDVVLESGQN